MDHARYPRWLVEVHYNEVIMSEMAPQIISLTIVNSTVYSRRRSKKTSKSRVTGLCEGNSPVIGEFPARRASNAENVPTWWHHHFCSHCVHSITIERVSISPFTYFSTGYFSDFKNITDRKAHSYVVGYTTAKLGCILSNANVILNGQPVFSW